MPIFSKEDERYGHEPGSFAFWRNLAVYFCVFSVLGHWMEIVYPLCQKALGKLSLRAMNLLAAVVVIEFVVLCAVKLA